MTVQTQTTETENMINRRWLDVLDKNNVNFMVLDPMHDRNLIEKLQACSDWIIEFATEDAVFFVREELLLNS